MLLCFQLQWVFIIRAAMKLAPRRFFVVPAPLLEEESNVVSPADLVKTVHPFASHRSGPRAGFATNDGPMNSAEVYRTNFPNQGFK